MMGCTSSLALGSTKRIAEKNKHQVNIFHGPGTVIPDDERLIIKRQWKVLSNDMKGLGCAVFMQIFKDFPEVKQLFPCRDVETDKLLSCVQFKGHAFRFMQAVAAVVDNIDDLDKNMSVALVGLGEQHVGIKGIKPAYFDGFYLALCKVWKARLGWRYKLECATAWNRVFAYIMDRLKEGYNSVLENRTAGEMVGATSNPSFSIVKY